MQGPLALTTYQVELPKVYQIEASAACNFKCPMCPRGLSSEHIDLELFQTIVDRDLGGSSYVELQFRGEPLLHPKFDVLLSYLKERGNVATGLSTNGSFLHKWQDVLYEYCDLLTISVDSLDPDRYATLRMPGSLEDLLFNIEAFLAGRPAWARTRVDLQVIDFFDTPSELPALEQLIRDREWPARARSVPDCFASQQEDQHRTHPTAQGDLCLNPWLSVSIQSDGDVVPCCYTFEKEYVYGNLRDNTLAEIWQGTQVAKFRALHRNDHLEGTYCETCYMRSPVMLHSKMTRDMFVLTPREEV